MYCYQVFYDGYHAFHIICFSLHIPLTTLSISIHNRMTHHLQHRKETKNIPNT